MVDQEIVLYIMTFVSGVTAFAVGALLHRSPRDNSGQGDAKDKVGHNI